MRTFCLFCVVLGLLFGCASSRKSSLDRWMGPSSDKLKILSTTAQVGDLVQRVGGDRIENWTLIQADLDPHSYELVKGDGEKFERADLIFYSGLELEHGASLSKQLRGNPKALGVGDAIGAKHPDRILWRGTVPDPHVWMDISLWKEGIEPVVETLSAKDPARASYYREQGRKLADEFDVAHLSLRKALHEVPEERRYLVTSHDAFHYFARGYLAQPGDHEGTARVAAPEGLAPDGQISPLDIQKIIDFLKTHKIFVIFPESNVSQDSIRKIRSAGKELKIDVRICEEPLYGDSTSGLSYLEMMQQNGEVLKCHLLLMPTN